jgi:hypothetical protein
VSALDAYERTTLHLPGGVAIDLRREPGDTERAALALLGVGAPPLAFLTAENPCGDGAPRAENDARMGALVRDLEARGIPHARVDGTAPDGSHRERLVAVALGAADAVRLAKRFEQLALFAWDGSRFTLLPAEADGAPRPLP